MSLRELPMLALKSVILGLALAFVLRWLWPGAPTGGVAEPFSYAGAVERASPAVVSILAQRQVIERVPFGAPLERFLGLSPQARVVNQGNLGSGVLIRDGYVLTNYHVVSAATEIAAQLTDGRVVRAVLIGSDPDTDLAVLKIDAADLPAAVIGEVGQLQVGDPVLAIGNPLGIGQSVTLGIVSATGRRRLNISTYENFIQTDAAINSGNSGGALVDARGRLVGINAAMLSRRIGAEGIGFAIPADVALDVMQQIITHGQVIRGWLGINLLERSGPAGAGSAVMQVVVEGVYSGAPAFVAGLQPGDVLLSLAGEPVLSADQFKQLEASIMPGRSVEIEASRAGLPFRVQATLTQRPKPVQ
jgi:S1-C subfamily serine protease